MERILSGFAFALLFCILGSVVYVRSSAEPQRAEVAKRNSLVKQTEFSGRRHAGIDVGAENAGGGESHAIDQIDSGSDL